ncbi:MAG: amino acid adenylation domain-containing protein [Cyanobacteria bacterium J06627_28]
MVEILDSSMTAVTSSAAGTAISGVEYSQLALDQLTLHQLVERQAVRSPSAIALTHKGKPFTYQELNEQANQLAHYLLAQRVVPEQLVAISVVRSPEMIVAFLAVLKASAAYVPIDPDYPEIRRQYILNDASVEIVLTQQSLASEFEGRVANVIYLDNEPALATQPTNNPNLSINPQQLAYVIYTSGSTGNPKGVMAHHRGLVNYSLALVEALALTPADRMLQFSTMSFDFIVSEVYPTLASGGSLALRTDEMVRSTQAFVDFIAREEVTVIQFTTAFWHELVNGIDRLGISLPPSLRLLLFGGEKASLTLCRQWVEKIGDYPRLFNAYGPTEATVITTLYDAVAEGYDGTTDLPIGRAIRNAKTYVLDNNLQPVAPGEAGELCIGGPGVTHGYLNLPDKTDKAFCDDPFVPGGRLYKTGDLIKMDKGGLIHFVGRVDFQVKIRGYRIELGEIESCLDQYPLLQSRIVIAREDNPGDKRLVAYIVMKPGETLNRSHLQAFMAEKLPAFMVPSAVVIMDELPKNANGKIDRKALPAPTRQSNNIVAPRTPLESHLIDIWCSILPLDNISITDNFFELGGNSLLVMRLFSQLEAELGVQLPMTDIFEAPTIAQLAPRIEQTTESDKSATDNGSLIAPLKIGTEYPSLFLVHDADGDTGLYLHLARQLGAYPSPSTAKPRTVYAIKPRTTAAAPLAHSRISTLAQDYVSQIRQAQPRGPYLVGGLCAGGVVAFEIGLQLEQLGEKVTLALLDTPAPGAKKKAGRITNARIKSFNQALGKEKRLDALAKSIWQKGSSVVRYEVLSVCHNFVKSARARALVWAQDKQFSLPKIGQPRSIRDVLVFAYEQYKPTKAFSGQMLLIRATQGNGSAQDLPYVEVYADTLLGWQPYCKQPIETCDAPGGHSTMLRSENVDTIAAAIEDFIEENFIEENFTEQSQQQTKPYTTAST